MKDIKEVTIELEDHEKQLVKAWELLKKVINEFKSYRDIAKKKAIRIFDSPTEEQIREVMEIPHDRKKFLLYMVDNILGAVGEMSISRFNVMEPLEEEYKLKYQQSPALGKTLFLEHYNLIHAPYDKLKNKCFDLLFKLDPTATIVDDSE